MKKIYPRAGDTQTVYLNAVVKDQIGRAHVRTPVTTPHLVIPVQLCQPYLKIPIHLHLPALL